MKIRKRKMFKIKSLCLFFFFAIVIFLLLGNNSYRIIALRLEDVKVVKTDLSDHNILIADFSIAK